ncbi:hypothetical protein EBQ91_04145 [bacterium]|nr:hypothetical protein [bacterium]
MALQSSGAISLLNVQNEFGGSNPIGINEYYGVAAGVPSSGTISLSDFYGKSNIFTTTYVFGYRDYTVASNQTVSNYLAGNVITPGSFYSPKTLNVQVTATDSGSGLYYYQNGSLFGSFGNFTNVNTTFTFGSSTMQFTSYLIDNDSTYGNNSIAQVTWLTSQGAPTQTTLYYHVVDYYA